MARKLPTVAKQEDLVRYLKVWNNQLSPLVKRIPAAKIPWGFNVEGKRGGIYLTWRPVSGADGYEIQRSDTYDMTLPESNSVFFLRAGVENTAYFDAISPTSGGTGTVRKYYRIHSTSGDARRPQSVKGLWSSVLSDETIDPTDTTTSRTAVYDTATNDETQARIAKFLGNRIYY